MLEVPPAAFKPAFKVDSAVVRLVPYNQLPYPAKRCVLAPVGSRLKPLTNAVKPYAMLFQPCLVRSNWTIGVDLTMTENLTIADYVRLANWLRQPAGN